MGEAAQTDIVLFGAGGHAKVVIETCIGTGYRPVVCLGESRWKALVDVPVEPESAAAAWLARGIRHAFIAIGSNTVRDRVAAKASAIGFRLATIVSRQAWVSPTARLGLGTVVMAGAIVQVEAELGELGIVNTGASIDHECRLGRAVHVAPHATLCGNVVAGDRVWIGAGSTVIEETKIADDVFIAAGATVTGDIAEPGTRCGGTPARPLRC
jgi:UDP-perosamine 4-acetyltransferase